VCTRGENNRIKHFFGFASMFYFCGWCQKKRRKSSKKTILLFVFWHFGNVLGGYSPFTPSLKHRPGRFLVLLSHKWELLCEASRV
jgi:hypothetical protein